MIGVGAAVLLALLAISTSDGSEPSCLFDKTESDAAPAPDSSCIEFKIDRLKVPQICDAFKKRKKGVQSANSTLSDKCDNTSGVLTCSCSKCTLEELVDDDKVKGMKELHAALQECLHQEKNTHSATSPTSKLTSKAGTSTSKSITQKIVLTTTPSIRLPKPKKHVAPEISIKYPEPPQDINFGLLVEDEMAGYQNIYSSRPSQKDSMLKAERAHTPSVFYNAQRQAEIYGTTETTLIVANIIILLYTVVVIRNILTVTLYYIFPDYKFLT
ncbi:hypothetical protein Q1695_006497 [Nippostrongylus brasiliensis]|nr:hypothetical protein Q1695_006497 [Nippostrongylus brasiliensis]